MKRAELLEQVGVKVLGWEFLRETPTKKEEREGKRAAITGSLPNPPDALWEALEGKRRAVLWSCGDPNKELLFYVAEAGNTEAVLWDPLKNEDQLQRIVGESESKLGYLPYDDGATPGEICEAILKALDAGPSVV